MSRRLLLGGSFNPPHLGHVAMAKKVAEHYGVSGVTFVPNFVNPLKELSVSGEHRVAMLRLCLPAGCEILTFEIERTEPSYTIDTLRYLKTQSDDELLWVIGADCLQNLHLWKDIKGILNLANFQLLTRPDSALELPDTLIELMGDRGRDMIDNVIELQMPYSSSEIRQALGRGQDPEGLDAEVLSYIRKERLYEIDKQDSIS